jgi:hypothetical protein
MKSQTTEMIQTVSSAVGVCLVAALALLVAAGALHLWALGLDLLHGVLCR